MRFLFRGKRRFTAKDAVKMMPAEARKSFGKKAALNQAERHLDIVRVNLTKKYGREPTPEEIRAELRLLTLYQKGAPKK